MTSVHNNHLILEIFFQRMMKFLRKIAKTKACTYCKLYSLGIVSKSEVGPLGRIRKAES